MCCNTFSYIEFLLRDESKAYLFFEGTDQPKSEETQ